MIVAPVWLTEIGHHNHHSVRVSDTSHSHVKVIPPAIHAPKTVHPAIDCGSLMAPIDGSITFTGTTFQSMAQYDCNQGYMLVGEEAHTCQSDGIWSGQEPVCNGE